MKDAAAGWQIWKLWSKTWRCRRPSSLLTGFGFLRLLLSPKVKFTLKEEVQCKWQMMIDVLTERDLQGAVQVCHEQWEPCTSAHKETQAQFLLLIGAVSELVDWAKPRWTHLCIWGIKRTIKRNSQIIFHFQTFRPPVICCSTKPRYSWTLFKFCKGEKFLTLAARCHHVRAEAELSDENTVNSHHHLYWI